MMAVNAKRGRKIYDPQLTERRRCLRIDTVPLSDLPCRVVRKRTGVILGSFEDLPKAEEFRDNLPLTAFTGKVVRKRTAVR